MKLTTLTTVALLIASSAAAWEQSLNPDRFISLGLNVSNEYRAGNFSSSSDPNGAPLVETGPAHDSSTGIGVDLRFPATESLTVSAGYTYIDGDSVHSRDNNVYRESILFTGYRLNLGARLYFNH